MAQSLTWRQKLALKKAQLKSALVRAKNKITGRKVSTSKRGGKRGPTTKVGKALRSIKNNVRSIKTLTKGVYRAVRGQSKDRVVGDYRQKAQLKSGVRKANTSVGYRLAAAYPVTGAGIAGAAVNAYRSTKAKLSRAVNKKGLNKGPSARNKSAGKTKVALKTGPASRKVVMGKGANKRLTRKQTSKKLTARKNKQF